MAQRAVIKLTRSKFEKTVKEMVEQRLFDILQSPNDKLFREITLDVSERMKVELNNRITELIRHKFEMEVYPYLIDSITHRVISDLIKERGVELIEEYSPDYQMIPKHPNRREARKPLKELISGAKMLLINDPYFFSAPRNISETDYINELIDILPLITLEKITVVHQKPKNTGPINLFEQKFPKSIETILVEDDSIHDRIWLIDDTKAFLVGTSFGGLGNKLAFILPLPDEDVVEFKSWIAKVIDMHKRI